MNFFLGRYLGSILFPQVSLPTHKSYTYAMRQLTSLKKQGKLSARTLTLQTADGALLDTVEINHTHCAQKPIDKQKYVIYLNQRRHSYDSILDEMVREAMTLSCHVVSFDWRGINHSSGQASSENMILSDVVSQVQRLISQGIDPENITLKGSSMGAAIATLAAKQLHDCGQRVNLFHDRSFSSSTNFVVAEIRGFVADRLSFSQNNFLVTLVGLLAKPIIWIILKLSGWSLDAASAYQSLPVTHKAYVLIRSIKSARETGCLLDQKYVECPDDLLPANDTPRGVIYDQVIAHDASLHVAMKQDNRIIKARIRDYLAESGLSAAEVKTISSDWYRARKMLGSHNDGMDELIPQTDSRLLTHELVVLTTELSLATLPGSNSVYVIVQSLPNQMPTQFYFVDKTGLQPIIWDLLVGQRWYEKETADQPQLIWPVTAIENSGDGWWRDVWIDFDAATQRFQYRTHSKAGEITKADCCEVLGVEAAGNLFQVMQSQPLDNPLFQLIKHPLFEMLAQRGHLPADERYQTFFNVMGYYRKCGSILSGENTVSLLRFLTRKKIGFRGVRNDEFARFFKRADREHHEEERLSQTAVLQSLLSIPNANEFSVSPAL